ncbi:MAG: threonine--tRNA ligase, partial [Deltaproteobacteria bacterium]|nr:threonine--tRNA ligase [Deltaproteobacteria bacterium]
YLSCSREAEARDHRKLGKELDLFSTMDDDGAGLVLWHPKGARIRKVIEDLWRERHLQGGYEILFTPHIARRDLWKTSGHLEFYKDYLYGPMRIDEVDYQLKPMNCPFHIKIFQSRLRSYRDLPFRWAELGTVYRYERSGVLHGLLRVRGFTQDDAHIFCRPDQLENEVMEVLDFTLSLLLTFGFKDYEVMLSTRPEKYVGSDEDWEKATVALRNALESKKIRYQIDPGEGVFYGPKIDIKIKDLLDRAWQCSTIQIDFNLPKRFQLTYVSENGDRVQPIMVHRALLGSLERFFGVLIEHYAGAFPVWLAPVQARIITVAEDQIAYGDQVAGELRAAGIRLECDIRNEKLGGKIRDAQLQKVPYMLILGKKEVASSTVSVRSRTSGDLGSMVSTQFIERILDEIHSRR